MTQLLKIEFNHPDILKGHVEQALPQAGLESIKDRFFIGKEGGLLLQLFEDPQSWSTEFSVSRYADMEIISSYFAKVMDYLQKAENCAHEFHFGLSTVSTDGYISKQNFLRGDRFYFAGIGYHRIGSSKKFKEFVKMVQSAHKELQEPYKEIVSLKDSL